MGCQGIGGNGVERVSWRERLTGAEKICGEMRLVALQ